MNCGLLGRKLGHSYSPQIHSMLGSYTYSLFEKEPEELAGFLRTGNFSGLNICSLICLKFTKSILFVTKALSSKQNAILTPFANQF